VLLLETVWAHTALVHKSALVKLLKRLCLFISANDGHTLLFEGRKLYRVSYDNIYAWLLILYLRDIIVTARDMTENTRDDCSPTDLYRK